MRRPVLLAVLVTLVATVAAQPSRAPQIESITAADLKADLYFLAGDGMKGRLTDTPENALAAEWIKSRFEHLGMKPAGPGGSFFHPYSLSTGTLPAAGNALEVGGRDGARLQPRLLIDYYPHRFSASGHARGEVVFAGFGITSAERGHDDFKGADLRGKVVLALDHEPGERDMASPFDGVVTSEAANAMRKTLAAQEKGAVAILFVDDVHNHPGPPNFEQAAHVYWPATPPHLERYTLASWVDRVRIPAAQISPALADVLLRGSGKSLRDLAPLAETRGGSTPVAVPAEVDVTTAVERHVIADRNVLAMVEGADPARKDEIIVVSAHYDHNGADGTQIFNGADDDGSGIVALLDIAEAYALAAKTGQRPKRSVLLAAWNSEERGLLGAWAYVEQPLYPLEKTIGVLNMDMLGRNEEVQEGGGARFRGLDRQTAESNNNAINVIGTARSAQMKTETERANQDIALDLRFRYDNNESNLMRRSDHWPFLQHGVPGLWFHTGLHPDYHTVYDRPEKINYVKMEKITRMIYQMSWNLAQQDGRPRLDAGTAGSR